jgi:hypothetical protein
MLCSGGYLRLPIISNSSDMQLKVYFTLCIWGTFASACQKVVSLDLNNDAPQLVIQGEVTDQPGPYTVTLAQGVDFYSDNLFQGISGAVVTISDGQTSDSLTETTPGTYITRSLQGRPGVTYTLSVMVSGRSYTAFSTMPAVVSLDSVTLEKTNSIRKDQINAVAHFHDPAGVPNYYQFREVINGTPFTNDIFVFDDRLSDGRDVSSTLRMDSAYLRSGDILQVDMYCVDSNTYNYFFELNRSSGTGAFNTAASPGNPDNNLTGGSYGYFSAHTVRSKSVRIN